MSDVTPGTSVASAFFAVLAICSVAAGTEYSISDTSDNFSINGSCNLREALYAAGSNTGYDTCPAGSTSLDTITLASDTFNFALGAEVTNPGDGPLRIQGSTSNREDTYITMSLQNSFIHMNSGSDDLTLRNLTVVFGKKTSGSGGVVEAIDSSLYLDNVALGYNQSDTQGGAVYFEADRGADDSLVIIGCNISVNGVSGNWPQGGGVAAEVSGTGEVRIEDSQFIQNTMTAESTQGGYGTGVRINATDDSRVTISRCEFSDNVINLDYDGPNEGAGLYIRTTGDATAEVTDCQFTDNLIAVPAATTTPQACGARFFAEDNSTLTADRLFLDGNKAENVAGTGASQQVYATSHDTATLTLSDGLAVNGLRAVAATAYDTSELNITHMTVAGNFNGIRITRSQDTATAGLYNSLFWNNTYTDNYIGAGVGASNNLTSVNPLFVDEPAGDYHLQSGSPAIGGAGEGLPGEPPYDLDHAPRHEGTHPDQGCYEYGGLFGDSFESQDTGAWSVAVN